MLSIIKSSMQCLVLRSHYTGRVLRQVHTTAVCDAARKGTREKAKKKKVKVEKKKVGFIPHNQRNKDLNLKRENKHIDDSWKQIAADDCYVVKYYRWPVYTVAEAVQCHRESHHPDVYNKPNAPLIANIELNMQGEKVTRFVDKFQRMIKVPHKFNHGEERRILVFTKGENELLEAKEAGAEVVGGVELIKDVTNGKVLLTDYQYVIAHPNILAELVTLRGLLKRKFPNPKTETLGTNLAEMTRRFSEGISYSANRDEFQQDFGLITTSVGTLNLDTQHLEENLSCLLEDVNSVRPRREGRFITRVLLSCPPCKGLLKIDPFKYIPEMYVKKPKPSEITEESQEENQNLKAEIN